MLIKEQYKTFLRRYEAEWVAERDSKPVNLDDGKYILGRLGNDLLEFRIAFDGQVDSKVISVFDDILRETRAIQQHRVYLDGGESYRAFWRSGDNFIKNLKEQIDFI